MVCKVISSCFLCVVAAMNFTCASADIEVHSSLTTDAVRYFSSDIEVRGSQLFDTIDGFIVLANPPDACTPIKKFHFNSNITLSKFVLIAGSTTINCSLERKIENAAEAEFDLAILYGEKVLSSHGGVKFMKSLFGDDDNEILGFRLAHNDGELIRRFYLYQNNSEIQYFLRVIPKQNYHYYLVLFSIVIAVCFIIIIMFMICLLVKYIQERRRSRRNRLSSRQIKQLPTEKYTKGDQYDVCAICLDNYNEGDKLRILPCSHVYHTKCIDPWLTENRRNCPLCKRKVRFGDTSSESDSDSEGASATESTPLFTPMSGDSTTWGTFAGPSTSGEQRHQVGEGQHPGRNLSSVIVSSQDDTESSESEIIATLPSVAGSVNAAYEDELNDLRPKSV